MKKKNPRIKEAILQVLENIKGYGIFDNQPGETAISIPQILASNKVHILNLSEIEEELLREIIVAKVLEDIFNYKKESRNIGRELRPLVLVMDECHNFVPEGRMMHTTPTYRKSLKKEENGIRLGFH